MMGRMKTNLAGWSACAVLGAFASGCSDDAAAGPADSVAIATVFSVERTSAFLNDVAVSDAGPVFVAGQLDAPSFDVVPTSFVARLPASGEGADAWRLERPGYDTFRVAAGSDGSVFVASQIFEDGALGTVALKAPAYPASFVAKLTSDGAAEWVKYASSPNVVSAELAARPDGGVVVAGVFSTTLSVGELSLEGELTGGGSHLYALSLAGDGAAEWLIGFRDDSVQSSSVAVDPASGDVALTGGFYGDINFGDGPKTSGPSQALFFARLKKDGSPRWSRHYIGGAQLRAKFSTEGELLVGGAPWSFTDVGVDFAVSRPFVARIGSGGATSWARLLTGPEVYQPWTALTTAPNGVALAYVETIASSEGVNGVGTRAVAVRAYDASGELAGEHAVDVALTNDGNSYGMQGALASNAHGDAVLVASESRWDPNTGQEKRKAQLVKLRVEPAASE